MKQKLFDRSVVLAPMAGVNDPVFRAICKRMGADLTYTEMVSAKGLEYNNKKTADMLLFSAAETPVAVQLFGKDPGSLAEQAKRIEERYGADIALIDINMGCPVRKVAGKGEGAALMKDPDLAKKILEAVVNAVSLPVTVKFRKGYGLGDNTALDFARMAEACGVAAVAVHGRTAQQFYTGMSDRQVVARVKQSLGIPVIASGDVFDEADIRFYLDECCVDAVMVARGARGNPWIFARMKPTVEQRVSVALEHVEGLAKLQPTRLPSMRKHIAWYFKGMPHAAVIRRAVNDCTTVDDYKRLLEAVSTW